MLKTVSIANKKSRTTPNDAPHDEYQYLNLVSDVITDGFDEVGRNGSVKCGYGAAMHFSLEDGIIPILTTKRTAWKTCLKELLWFIRGKMDNVKEDIEMEESSEEEEKEAVKAVAKVRTSSRKIKK